VFKPTRRLSTTREGTRHIATGRARYTPEDGRIDRADAVSSIGTVAREGIGRAGTRGDAR